MSNAENSARIGDNQPEAYADRIADALKRDYADLERRVAEVLAKAHLQPKDIATDEEAVAVGAVVKEIRDLDKEVEAFRTAEKGPHESAVKRVNAFFFELRERLAKRDRNDRSQKPGAADVLQLRINAHLERKRLEEQQRRQREAEEQARIAREARERAEAEALAEARRVRDAEEARQAAERARNPERREEKASAAQIAQAQAAEQGQRADAAKVEAQVAVDRAQDARVATLAKPAELSRTRGEGVLLTETRQSYAEVADRNLLDKAALWPFFKDDEIEKALRGWARTTGHNVPMAGALIGHRAKGQTR